MPNTNSGVNPVTNKKMNQVQRLMFHMANSVMGVTRQDAMVNLGVANLTARISDLDYYTRDWAKCGDVTREEMRHTSSGARYYRYRLTSEQRSALVSVGLLTKVSGTYWPTLRVKTL